MADVTEKVIQWKKLWQLVSGIHFETPNQTVLEKLREVSKELIDGVKNNVTSNKQISKEVKDKCPEKLLPFIEKLQHYLNIDSNQSWDLFCIYVVNEYRGSANSLSNYLLIEANNIKPLNDIWELYSLERIIMLKIMKNLLEFYTSSSHPYSIEYKTVLEEIKLSCLRKSYIDQFEYLIKSVPPAKLTVGEFFNSQNKLVSWSERKIRETIEVLNIILLIVDNDGILPVECKKLVDLFKLHSFGRQQQFLDSSNKYHCDLITKISYSEVALFMKCVDISDRSNIATWIIEIVNLLDDDIIEFHQNSEHGPILLSWMLLNFNTVQVLEDEENSAKYRQFGTHAAHLGVFEYLYNMICHPMYRDQSIVAKTVKQTIYNHLSHLCNLFDEDGSVAQHSHIYNLLSELLKTPSIATYFCYNEDSGVRSLFNTALENFPVDFISLSTIAHALASTGTYNYAFIQQQLENLPIYTEYYNPDNIQLRASPQTEDEFILINNYTPFKKIDYTIPASTTAVLIDKQSYTGVHFRVKVNYFDVLHNEINQLLVDTLKHTEIDDERQRRVISGLKYLAIAVRRVQDPNEISSEMVHPTEMVFDILMKFKMIHNPPIEMLAKCLEVCAALLPLFEKEIIKRVINYNIFPYVANENLDYKSYANGVSFESGQVGYYLINLEKNIGKYDFLLAYLNFLRTYSKLSLNNTNAIELPSLIFMLREIFPYLHSWRFETESERQQIYALLMQNFFDILQLTTEQLTHDSKKVILRNTCIYSLLNIENGMILLRFVALGNDFLQSAMQNESNWMTASHAGFNLLVQLAMTILMQILRLINNVVENNAMLSPLESIIYTQPKQRDTLRIIPVVTSYMSNIFNRRLPVLSCRLLRRFAIEFQMSLLACLDMEADQIRLTFLQRLREELESDNLKIAVIEFVEACINKQPGLTEAFFKISYRNENRFLVKLPKTKNIADGVLTYMTEYLDVIFNDPGAIVSPLLSKIMSLFHALWKNNMQSLVQELINKTTFWPSLINPLYGPIHKDIRAYSQLFNILGFELFRCSSTIPINENLKKAFEKFFDAEIFETWIDAILDIPREVIDEQVTDETPEWLCRLQSFKDLFVIIVRKQYHGIHIPHGRYKYFADKCLAALVERSEYTDDFRPFIILSELYLILLISLKKKYTNSNQEDDEMLQQITLLLNSLSISYREIHTRARGSVLALAIKSVDLLANELCNNLLTTSDFMRSIVEIIGYELTESEKAASELKVTSKIENECLNLPFILSVNLLKKISLNFSSEGVLNWADHLISNKICNRLLSCLYANLQIYKSRKIVIEILDLLIIFAKDPYYNELLYCDIGNYLSLKLLPPKELLQIMYTAPSKNVNKWQTNDWWPIYARGIQLATALLQKHKYLFLSDAIIFVGVHEEFLMDSILLAKQALDPDAVVLIKTSLEFVSELIQYEKQWRLEHSQSMINLMRCVQIMLDHAVSLLYRPKILKRLIEGGNTSNMDIFSDTTTLLPTNDLITAMNDLIEMVTICSKCLLVFSPKLLSLIVEPEFAPTQWQPLVEIQFGAPKLNVGGTIPQLTFGTILSAACIFTKTLNLQHYTFDPTPLNTIFADDQNYDDNDETTRSHIVPKIIIKTSITTPQESSSRSPFTKSLSMTSATSTVPSNDILLNLEDALCITALEYVMTLLASQSLLALKDVTLSNRDKQLIKRELSTELSIYHDFVKKRILSELKGPLYRKKQGMVLLKNSNFYDQHPSPSSHTERPSSHSNNSMRVSVTRKLHLHKTDQKTPSLKRSTFEMTRDISPIGVSTPKKSELNLPSSTPIERISRPTIKSYGSPSTQKRVISSCDEPKKVTASDTKSCDSDDKMYTGLSMINLVEEDYLHFLSNLFHYICQND